MIPQIIRQHVTRFLDHTKKQKKTFKGMSLFGFYAANVEDLLEAFGEKARTKARDLPGVKKSLQNQILRDLGTRVGLLGVQKPWELHYTKEPKATWGALSHGVMHRRYTVKEEGEESQDVWTVADLVEPSPKIKKSGGGKCTSATKMRATRIVGTVNTAQNTWFTKCQRVEEHGVSTINVDIPESLKQPEDSIIISENSQSSSAEKTQKEYQDTNQMNKGKTSFLGRLLRLAGSQQARRDQGRGEKRVWVRDMSTYTVGVYALSCLLFLSLLSSAYIFAPLLNAEVKIQNFTKSAAVNSPGLQLLAYENRTDDEITSEAEFDTGTFTDEQFETSADDIDALVSNEIALGHYGDTPPDLSAINWWDDDSDTATNYNWRYRRCFDIDNSASTDDMIEYQIYLDLDTQTLITDGEMLASGADMRFLSEDGDVLPHVVHDDINTVSTKVWVQVDDIPAGDAEQVCMYYGNPGATDSASRADVFTYDAPKPIYHVVADTADGSITEFASYSDDNDITVSGYTGTLDAQEFASHPSVVSAYTETSAVSTTHPINATYETDGLDNLVPASAAGTEFVYRTDRYTNEFSIISPWCAASLTFENGSGNNILDTASATSSPFAVTAGGSVTITTNDTVANGLPNNDVVIIEEVGADCPVLISHHGTTGGDSYTMFPTSDEWYGVGSGSFNVGVLQDTTSITVYKSDGSTVGPTVYNRGDGFNINDAGSQGAEVAHRVVADKPVGAQARGDGDGGDAVTFLPVGELGHRYYVADVSQYIAIATTAGTTTTVDLYHDGNSCGTGIPDDTATVAPTGNFPGKVYFGSTTDGDNIPMGACIIADNPVYAYNEYNTAEDEHNLWNEKQNRQFISPAPTYSVGTEEIGLWPIDGTNNWIRRVPITVSNTAATAIDEYQMRIDLGADVTTLFGETQVDGGDIRVAGALGDGTDDAAYFLESFNDVAQTGTLWIQTPVVPAASTAVFYIYYGPIGIDLVGGYSPLLWLDAADNSTITQTAGALNIAQDKSTTGNHFSAAVGEEPVVALDGIKQVFTFDGTNDELQDADGIYANGTTYNDFTNFIVYKDLTLGTQDAVFTFDALGGETTAYLGPWGATLTYWRPSVTWTPYTYGGDTTDYHVMRLENDTTGTNQKSVYRDNALVGQTPGGGQAVTGDGSVSIIGNWLTGTGFRKDMQFAEMITIPSTVGAAGQAEIEQYLTEKWITRPSTSLTTTGDYNTLWQTTAAKPNYYIVDELAVPVGSLNVISFADGNTVDLGAGSDSADEGEIITIPVGAGISDTDIYTVGGPLSIGYNGDTTDAALPISYAGNEFLMRVGRNTDAFSFYAPYATASVQIQQSSGTGFTTLQTVSVPAGTALSVTQDIINNRAFKILADEPILAFHRNDGNDSKILYPVESALVASTGKYELYGVAANALQLAATAATTVDIYRSDGSSNLGIVIDGTTNFGYTEAGGGGIQGTARGYRIVSDDPIAASSYADSDGGETVIFLPQKEFADEYILPNPAQYMSIVSRDAGVECRVYDETGTAVTTGPGALDNLPPQTGGTNALPLPNQIHIGGDDTADPAYFAAGYRLECDEPVYAYYEHHLSTAVTDETSWLSWPQARTRNYIEPTIGDVNGATEEGLYYESGFDSAGAASDPVAEAEYIFDNTAGTYGDHTYWRDITWTERITDRGALNSVQQVKYETAYANGPNCSAATYSAYVEGLSTITESTSTDTSPPFHNVVTNSKKALIEDVASDHACLKVRVTLLTGDPVLTPVVEDFMVGYYDPALLEGQLDTPTIDVADTVGVTDETFRILKAFTTDAGLAGSEANLTYRGISDDTDFTTAEFDFIELPSNTFNGQFTFPLFPVAPVTAVSTSTLDASNSIILNYIGQRSAGADEQISMTINVDIENAGGPTITRDFIVDIEG